MSVVAAVAFIKHVLGWLAVISPLPSSPPPIPGKKTKKLGIAESFFMFARRKNKYNVLFMVLLLGCSCYLNQLYQFV